MSDARAASFELEMGYSADEFKRVLPLAMRDWSVEGGMPRWRISDPLGHELATVHIAPRPERVMGALRLPVLWVSIEFGEPGAELSKEFMRRFERGFHRGGG